MTEDLKILKQRAWELIKAIDRVSIMGSDQELLPKKKIKVYYGTDYVIDICCEHFSITRDELTYARRMGDYVSRRVITMKLLMEFTKGTGVGEITNLLGYKQHGTILHHLKEFNQILDGKVYDHKYMKRDYEAIKKRLEA